MSLPALAADSACADNVIYQGPKTTVDLTDLGTKDPRAAGIWSPDYRESVVAHFIHDQFLDDAGTYIEKYTSYASKRRILAVSQEIMGLPAEGRLTILDLGSGAGNTVFPLLDLYPNATVVASDLSVPMLRALRRKQVEEYGQRDCWVMQLNAEELVFEDAQFDLVVGAAILHHLFDPEKSIREAYRVLKPGGVALFFEPFEAGYQILGLAMKHLTATNDLHRAHGSGELICEAAIDVFHRMRIDWEARKGSDKSGDLYRHLDDKWLFTRSYLERVGSRCGFSDLTVYPTSGGEGLFSGKVRTLLRLCLGQEEESLPKWAQQYLAELDQHFSPDASQDLVVEGGIVFRK